MELAVTPFRALTHEVRQFMVGQYGRLLLPAVPPAPTPEVTTLGAGQRDQRCLLGSCQAGTQNLNHHRFQLTLTHRTGGLGLRPPSLRLSCGSWRDCSSTAQSRPEAPVLFSADIYLLVSDIHNNGALRKTKTPHEHISPWTYHFSSQGFLNASKPPEDLRNIQVTQLIWQQCPV